MKAVLFLLNVAAFLPLWVDAGWLGWTRRDDFGHVFVVPLIGIVVYFLSRGPADDEAGPRWAGPVMWGCGLLAAAIAALAGVRYVTACAFPLVFAGSIWTLYGSREGRRVVFLAFFLLFSLGVPSQIMLQLFSRVLRLVAAGASYDVIHTWLPGGEPYILSATLIYVPKIGHAFDVVQECSGIRGITALFILGALVGWHTGVSGRAGVLFAVALFALAAVGNVLRIAATLFMMVAADGDWEYTFLHDMINMVVFGGLVLLTPVVSSWARGRKRAISVVELWLVLLMLGYGVSMSARAVEGNIANVQLQQQPGEAKPAITQIETIELPRRIERVLSPRWEGRRQWWWLIASGFVHLNIAHLATNFTVLLLIGRYVEGRLGPWMTGVPLVAGQLVGQISELLLMDAAPTGTNNVFLGASAAASGIVGAYLAVAVRERKIGSAIFIAAAFALCMILTPSQVSEVVRFSTLPHINGLVAGFAAAWICSRGCIARDNKPPPPQGAAGVF